MRIAFFHELHQGGARRAANELAKELQKRHTVDFYLLDEGINKEEAKNIKNYFLYKFHSMDWKGGNWKKRLYRDTLELLKLYNLHKKIAQEIDVKKYDIVFVHPSKFTQSPFILRFLKSKKVYYCQEPLRMIYEEDFDINNNLGFLKKTYERINRFLRKKIDISNIQSADVVIANSHFTKQNILKAYNIKSSVCYLGVDVSSFKPINSEKDIDILFLGAKNSVEGFDLLEKSIGQMSFKPKLKTVVAKKNWDIKDKELCRLYGRSKVVICLMRNEPFGLIPLEAMSCSTPVVAINEGGYKETVVQGKNGFLVPRDAQTIAKKIEWIVKNESESHKLGKNARNIILKDWTWEKSAKRIEKMFENLNS